MKNCRPNLACLLYTSPSPRDMSIYVEAHDFYYDDDKNAERKRRDMNNRLNKIYEEIYSIEDQIIDCEMRKASAEQNTLTKDNVYKMLLVFDKMNDADKRKLIESMILEVQLHPKETWDCLLYTSPSPRD
mgnify:CR=1 FL=1